MTIVVKIGGAVGNSTEPLLAEMSHRPDVVLVHGGSAEIDQLGAEMGRPSEYYTSPSGVVSRRNDPSHLEVVVLALAGKVQTSLVAGLARHGVAAVGLSGVDGGLLRARRKEGARALVEGHVLRVANDASGDIESVNADLLWLLLGRGLLPVVGPPAVTAKGEIVNVDADRVAARIACALGATDLIFLTNVSGLLRHRDDPASRVRRVSRAEIPSALEWAQGRMRKKVLAARDALEGGVGCVAISASDAPDPIGGALNGTGTVFA
jgi:[amino group carrier protein]-L-2-aminoadipate 6-kinase